MLGGVAAGIARTYGWDVTLVRLAFVVAALVGVGVPAYVVAWVVIPPDPDDGTEVEPRERGALVGLVLLGIGVLWLGGRIFPNGGDLVRLAWPLALVAGGIAVLLMRSGPADRPDAEGSGAEQRPGDDGPDHARARRRGAGWDRDARARARSARPGPAADVERVDATAAVAGRCGRRAAAAAEGRRAHPRHRTRHRGWRR